MNHQYFDMDKGKNIIYMTDCSSTSGYSSANSPTSVTLSPAHSPETLALQSEFANLNLPPSNSPHHQQPLITNSSNSPYQQPTIANQLLTVTTNGNLCIDASNLLNNATPFVVDGNMYMDHQYYATPIAQQQNGNSNNKCGGRDQPWLEITEQPVEKFRFRYKSEMHGTHGSLNGANSKRTPKTYPEVQLRNYNGPAVIRCSLFQTNLDSPHSHQLVVRRDERDVCDPHDLHVSKERGYCAQFLNMGIIHTAKKFIFDELLKKKEERLIFQIGRREPSTKQMQELHQETEREAKDMNLNQVRLCFEAFKIEEDKSWRPIASPVFSNPINNRKSAQTGELRIVRLSKPTGGVMGNDELILLVEKVSKKNIKVRFFEENDDGETVWEAYAKFRESDVHHQYAIVCQTPAYKDKDVDREVNVSIELIRPSDDERSYPPLPFRYKPREAVSRKRRRTCSTATTSSSSGTGSAKNSFELPKTLQTPTAAGGGGGGSDSIQMVDKTISQEFGRDSHWNDIMDSENFRKFLDQDSGELEKLCQVSEFGKIPDLIFQSIGELQADGNSITADSINSNKKSSPTTIVDTKGYLNEIFKNYDSVRAKDSTVKFEVAQRKVEQLFSAHAAKNLNNDTLIHEVISQKHDDLKLTIKAFQVMEFFKMAKTATALVNADGDSGLHFACQQDRQHYIRPLLSLGCNPNIQNSTGNTALHLAVKDERIACIESFLNGKNVKLDLSLKNDDGLTPLHMAIRQNKYDVAKKLINQDRTSINVCNTKDGNNALHMAVLEQNVELLVLILDADDLTDILLARNSAGYTPLELARQKANDRCVRLLEEVYPDKGEFAMTWIPINVKEEMDSSSAEDEDESSESNMEVKVERMEDTNVEQTPEQKAITALDALLNDTVKSTKLAKMLNEPSTENSSTSTSSSSPNQIPKWKEMTKKSNMNHLAFLWSTAEEMLNYVQHKSSRDEYKSFANALSSIDLNAIG